MSDVDLYNLSPALRMMGVGLLIALLPLAWIAWRHREGSSAERLQALTVLTLFLTFDLVLFGAVTRLTDSGLGCPDWPGCYGSASPLGAVVHIDAAQSAMPTGPVTHGKAWIEMVHRYAATSVGVLILFLAVCSIVFRQKVSESFKLSPGWACFTLLWVCAQGAFGALTVTMKLFPAIVSLHLLGGIGLLALLSLQVAWRPWAQREKISAAMQTGLWVGFILLCLQIGLGAWVSTNYAVLACTGFPDCSGQWWPQWDGSGFEIWRALGMNGAGQLLSFSALVSIHWAHRLMALGVLTFLLSLAWRMHRQGVLQTQARWLALLSALQFSTGLSNVVLDWPLVAALAHTGGAGAMVMVLTWALSRSRSRALTFSLRPAL